MRQKGNVPLLNSGFFPWLGDHFKYCDVNHPNGAGRNGYSSGKDLNSFLYKGDRVLLLLLFELHPGRIHPLSTVTADRCPGQEGHMAGQTQRISVGQPMRPKTRLISAECNTKAVIFISSPHWQMRGLVS